MSFQEFNCLLKIFLFFNITVGIFATKNENIEASFDGNLESSFTSSITAMFSLEKEDIPTTSSFYSLRRDFSVFKTQAPYEKLDFFDDLGNKIDRLAQAVLHGNLGHMNEDEKKLDLGILAVCNGITLPLGILCTVSPTKPASTSAPGMTTSPGGTSGTPGMTTNPKSDRFYLTNNPALNGTVSPENRYLIEPSQVSTFFYQTTLS